ncbi:MAG TPA: PEP-utilizing enzyme [Pseudonocardia sp.]|jgi:pyruvate,water dikinase
MRQPWITDTQPSSRYPHYTRANAGEVLPDPVTPLGWTFVWQEAFLPGWCDGNEATGAFAAGELDRSRPQDVGGNFAGYYYINLSSMRMHGVRNPDVTLEQLEAGLLGAHPDVPPYLPHPGDERPDLADGIAAHTRWTLTADRWPELDTDRARAEALRRARPELVTESDAGLLARARSTQPLLRESFARHAVSSFGAAASPAVLAAIGEALGRPELPSTVLAGLGDIESARPVQAQWELSRMIRHSDRLSGLFDEGTGSVLAGLRTPSARPEVSAFARAWQDYLDQYGYRGPSEWELMAPSYHIDPSLGLILLDSIRRQPDEDSPARRAERHRAPRERTIAEVRAALAGQPESAAAFESALHAARFIGWRERTKSTSVQVLNETRLVFHELSRRAVRSGHLEEAGDLYMLTSSELDDYWARPARMGHELAARRRDWTELFTRQPPFIIADGKVPALEHWARRGRPVEPESDRWGATVLRGISGSAGTVTGRARIIHDPFDPDGVEPGEILVAPNTDPSWTPLFLVAAGVVVDSGSQISHSVIVSRELGLPCVVAATGASRTIPNGTLITVNGSTGTIHIH